MKRQTFLAATVAISFLCCQGAVAQQAAEKKQLKDVDIDAFSAETQKTLGTKDSLNLVWIIPIEFWQASLAQDNTLPEFQRRQVIDALNKYVMVGVVRADISPLGAFRFHDERKVLATLKVTVGKNKGESTPLKLLLKADNEDAQLVVTSMKPILKEAMGRMGDNFHLFICHNQLEGGGRLLSPYEAGNVRITMSAIGQNKGGTMEIAFPLDSLHVPRMCADCGKRAHISWSYCPFCGKKHAR